jgi:splicing factor 3A subunit 3
MLYEDLRFIHEDLERLEQAVADRVAENPSNVSAAIL